MNKGHKNGNGVFKMNTKKPNIFNLATNELSQDAFFTWLLQWADPQYRNCDRELHNCAQSFVKMLINDDKTEIKNIIADRQLNNIDIWAKVNNEIFIAIEDKTFTGEHSQQLENYKNAANKLCCKNNHKLICVYLKTGSESEISLKKIYDKGYTIIDRPKLICLFDKHQTIKNNIYFDFLERLKSIEEDEKTFEYLKLKDWKWESWIGFYKFLESKIDADWGYVSNPRGGFLGLWWSGLLWEKHNIYMQIDSDSNNKKNNGKLCFKISEISNNHSSVRNKCSSIIIMNAQEKGKMEIVKPQRFGSGNGMTVAVVEKKAWLGDPDSIIKKDEVVNKLKEYEHFIKECFKV